MGMRLPAGRLEAPITIRKPILLACLHVSSSLFLLRERRGPSCHGDLARVLDLVAENGLGRISTFWKAPKAVKVDQYLLPFSPRMEYPLLRNEEGVRKLSRHYTCAFLSSHANLRT